MQYNFNEIEAKWQKKWAKWKTFEASNTATKKPPFYVLDMFPYPSGAGLHVGHPLGYIASDIIARYKRHKGYNVLHPQGYDSFGLPAEQYAIQTGQHPAKTTDENINRYRQQLDQIGFSFDWSREVRTSNPDYYRWTQWIFIQLFNSYYCTKENKAKSIEELVAFFVENGNENANAHVDDGLEKFSANQWKAFSTEKKGEILQAYRLTFLAESEVNWCPALGTVLANDEIINGKSERGGHPVVRKKMKQWSMRISAYAERLLQGLNKIECTESLKESQRNWIGKSEGALVKFAIKDSDKQIEVFTTRPDTIFGVSFMTLAPEHDLVAEITTEVQKNKIDKYIEATSLRTERERMADVKTISGEFTGAYAIHPFSGKEIPIWIGDYVLAGYGTGAVMAVPCGDQRDFDFAKHFSIEIPSIFEGIDVSEKAFTEKENVRIANSDFLNGLTPKEAIKLAINKLEKIELGKGKINYRLRDAVFSRQRYWGEPFPVFYKNGTPTMIHEQHLPIILPEVDEYLPTEAGDPPLGRAKNWAWDTTTNEVVNNEKIDNETVFPLELNTMPGWAGSSWYMFRYMDPSNKDVFASKEALNYWQHVDLYIGGSEHATGHLLYVRFWTKFLFDRNFLSVDEPFKKLINQGMILGESAFAYRDKTSGHFVTKSKAELDNVDPIHVDVSMVNTSNELDIEAFQKWRSDYSSARFICEDNGSFVVAREVEKMSKSKFNVVNPDDICAMYGADTLRMYEMFLGPLEQAKPWNTAGISGVNSFLKKLWKLYVPVFENPSLGEQEPSKESLKTLHKTIKKVTEDIEEFSFNTSVSTFMICVNELTQQKCTSLEILEKLAVLISPYAPHIAEELWEQLGNKESISTEEYPMFDEKYLVEDTKTYPISFNGKMRFTLDLPLSLTKEEIESAVMADERTQKQLEGRTPKKVIIVPGKIVNLVG